MDVRLEPFVAADHLTDTAGVLQRLRRVHPYYPPPADATNEIASLAAWLDDGDSYLARWVAVRGDVVVGHIAVTAPHDYILNFLDASKDLAEITKFFVDPAAQRDGVGALLFTRARDFIRESGSVPVLAVVSTSSDALNFYPKNGMRELGFFEGVHGTNYVFGGEAMAPISN